MIIDVEMTSGFVQEWLIICIKASRMPFFFYKTSCNGYGFLSKVLPVNYSRSMSLIVVLLL